MISMEYRIRLDRKVAFLFGNEGLLRSTSTTECSQEIHMIEDDIKKRSCLIYFFFPSKGLKKNLFCKTSRMFVQCFTLPVLPLEGRSYQCSSVITCKVCNTSSSSRFLRLESPYCLENDKYKIPLFLILNKLLQILILFDIFAKINHIYWDMRKITVQLRMLFKAVQHKCDNSSKCLSKGNFF